MCFFCFKQKTAYEMRISDWSSDVCSSDLTRASPPADERPTRPPTDLARPSRRDVRRHGDIPACRSRNRRPQSWILHRRQCTGAAPLLRSRSEEHTSELQSLMRISYAVFCLKKKHTKDTKS